MKKTEPFRQWVLLELMGHRRVAGFLTEEEIGGQSFLRIDVRYKKEHFGTQYYHPNAIYSITPTDETTAYLCSQRWVELPVKPWELKTIYSDAGPLFPPEEEEEEEKEDMPF